MQIVRRQTSETTRKATRAGLARAIRRSKRVDRAQSAVINQARMRAARKPHMGLPYPAQCPDRRQLTLEDYTFIHYTAAPYSAEKSTVPMFGKIEVYRFDYRTGLEMFVGYASGELYRRVSLLFQAAQEFRRRYCEHESLWPTMAELALVADRIAAGLPNYYYTQAA